MGFPFYVKATKEEQYPVIKIIDLFTRIMSLFGVGIILLISLLFLTFTLLAGEAAGPETIFFIIIPLAMLVPFGALVWMGFSTKVIIKKDLQKNELILKRYFFVKGKEIHINLRDQPQLEIIPNKGPLSMYGKKGVIKTAQETISITHLDLIEWYYMPLSTKDIEKISTTLGLEVKSHTP